MNRLALWLAIIRLPRQHLSTELSTQSACCTVIIFYLTNYFLLGCLSFFSLISKSFSFKTKKQLFLFCLFLSFSLKNFSSTSTSTSLSLSLTPKHTLFFFFWILDLYIFSPLFDIFADAAALKSIYNLWMIWSRSLSTNNFAFFSSHKNNECIFFFISRNNKKHFLGLLWRQFSFLLLLFRLASFFYIILEFFFY